MQEENNQKNSNPTESYQDPLGITNKNLDFGLWYVRNLKKIKLSLIIFLITVSTLCWGFFAWGFLSYIIYGMNEDTKLLSDLTQAPTISHELILADQPEPLAVDETKLFINNKDTIDATAKITNANLSHWADFYYYFVVGQEETRVNYGILMPGESKYISALGQEISASSNTSVELVMEKINWHRINNKTIPDWEQFKNSRLNFSFDKIIFKPYVGATISKTAMNQLDFLAKNNTAYNYWNVNLSIAAFQGTKLVGVASYSLENFKSKEERNISFVWTGNIGKVDSVEITPVVNIFDSKAYKKVTDY